MIEYWRHTTVNQEENGNYCNISIPLRSAPLLIVSLTLRLWESWLIANGETKPSSVKRTDVCLLTTYSTVTMIRTTEIKHLWCMWIVLELWHLCDLNSFLSITSLRTSKVYVRSRYLAIMLTLLYRLQMLHMCVDQDYSNYLTCTHSLVPCHHVSEPVVRSSRKVCFFSKWKSEPNSWEAQKEVE